MFWVNGRGSKRQRWWCCVVWNNYCHEISTRKSYYSGFLAPFPSYLMLQTTKKHSKKLQTYTHTQLTKIVLSWKNWLFVHSCVDVPFSLIYIVPLVYFNLHTSQRQQKNTSNQYKPVHTHTNDGKIKGKQGGPWVSGRFVNSLGVLHLLFMCTGLYWWTVSMLSLA